MTKLKNITLVFIGAFISLLIVASIAPYDSDLPRKKVEPSYEVSSNCKLLLEMERNYGIEFDPKIKKICSDWGFN